MPTVDIDHIAFPTADPERLIAFYRRLGLTINDAEWRAGTSPVFSIQIGPTSKLNVHPPGFVQEDGLQAPAAASGGVDICFVWEGTVDDCLATLRGSGAEVIFGPTIGRGARVGLPATRLYVRDPDGNLLEWMIYG